MPILTEKERLGTLVAGRYRLGVILGRGGTGVVYEATHTWTNRRVAVKLLRPEYAQDVSLVRRFLQEARASAELAHPNVVDVLDMGADRDGTVYLVLELLAGESLNTLLTRETTLSVEACLRHLVPILYALSKAHRKGIIHRDLKPDNIFIRRDDLGAETPKLLDFGMARMVATAWGNATENGTLIGTPFYMSPEQAEGADNLGPQTDVWSMGVLFYRCLSGKLPFFATTPTALLLAIARTDPEPLGELRPDIPDEIVSVIERALTKSLEGRYPSIDHFILDLSRAATKYGFPLPTVRGDSSGLVVAEGRGEGTGPAPSVSLLDDTPTSQRAKVGPRGLGPALRSKEDRLPGIATSDPRQGSAPSSGAHAIGTRQPEERADAPLPATLAGAAAGSSASNPAASRADAFAAPEYRVVPGRYAIDESETSSAFEPAKPKPRESAHPAARRARIRTMMASLLVAFVGLGGAFLVGIQRGEQRARGVVEVTKEVDQASLAEHGPAVASDEQLDRGVHSEAALDPPPSTGATVASAPTRDVVSDTSSETASGDETDDGRASSPRAVEDDAARREEKRRELRQRRARKRRRIRSQRQEPSASEGTTDSMPAIATEW